MFLVSLHLRFVDRANPSVSRSCVWFCALCSMVLYIYILRVKNHSGSLSRGTAKTSCWSFAILAALISAFTCWVIPYMISAVPRGRLVENRYTHASLNAVVADALLIGGTPVLYASFFEPCVFFFSALAAAARALVTVFMRDSYHYHIEGSGASWWGIVETKTGVATFIVVLCRPLPSFLG